MNRKHHGILAGGNFIVDRVKVIDRYPQEEMLASILSESISNGGGPYNVLKDLTKMAAPFPLAAVGLIGMDEAGDWIIADCQSAGIDVSQLHRTDARPTSYTDAMTVESTGKRTFFHQRGANALLDTQHFDFSQSQSRIFHLGYLTLLDQLDKLDDQGRTRASYVLEAARQAGLTTSVDLVSVDEPRFASIARAAIPWIDHLIINETEAALVLGITLHAREPDGLLNAATQLIASGVDQTVTIHTECGAVCCTSDGDAYVQPALALQNNFTIKGANGAGDAFAAGYLFGLHEGDCVPERLRLAVCSAAMSLSDPTPSGGLRSKTECLALADEHPAGKFGRGR